MQYFHASLGSVPISSYDSAQLINYLGDKNNLSLYLIDSPRER